MTVTYNTLSRTFEYQGAARTPKGKIALTPFPDLSVKTVAHGTGSVRVARIENKQGLVELKAVFAYPEMGIVSGQSVWVRANTFTSPQAKEIMKIEDKEFILLSDSYVEVIG
jgi:hypothetical protein